MLSHLHGTVFKGSAGEVTVDIAGVGYRVHVPLNVWDTLEEGQSAKVFVTTYVREDRFELFGFIDQQTRSLFEHLIGISGIGPRTALELCGAPRSLLSKAIAEHDSAALTDIKGIGKKTAEKLVIELSSLAEKHPMMFATIESTGPVSAARDPDALAALTQLGYPTSLAMRALEKLPKTLQSTEERVAAALKNL